MSVIRRERVIVYIDGYNLYNGMKDSGFERYKWLDIQSLATNVLNSGQELVMVKYFTTLVTSNVNRRQRQKQYIGALESKDLVKIIFGKFQNEKKSCGVCGVQYIDNCEKMTDVGIATQMMIDYFEDNFDMAMVISGDTDLLPPIRYINNNGKNKRAFVAFPPNRVNDEVRGAAKGSMVIGRKILADSQFPKSIVNQNGETFNCPLEWS